MNDFGVVKTEKEIKEKIDEIEKVFSDIADCIELYESEIVVKTLKWVLGEIDFDDILED